MSPDVISAVTTIQTVWIQKVHSSWRFFWLLLPSLKLDQDLAGRDTVYYRGSVSLYDDLDILDEKITASTTQQIALLCL